MDSGLAGVGPPPHSHSRPSPSRAGAWRRWPLGLIAAIPVLLAATVYAEALPPEYTAEAVVSFAPRPETNLSADIVRLQVARYATYAASLPTVSGAADASGVAADRVEKALTVTAPTDSSNLRVSVTLESRDDAIRVAAAITDRVLRLANSTETLVNAGLVVPASADSSPTGPPRRLIELLGLVTALALAVLVPVAAQRFWPRIYSEQDLLALGAPGRLARMKAKGNFQVGGPGTRLRPVVDVLGGFWKAPPVRRSVAMLTIESGRRSPDGGAGVASTALGIALTALKMPVVIVDVAGTAGFDAVAFGARTIELPKLRLLEERKEAVRKIIDHADRSEAVLVSCPPILRSNGDWLVAEECSQAVLVVEEGTSGASLRKALAQTDEIDVGVVATILRAR